MSATTLLTTPAVAAPFTTMSRLFAALGAALDAHHDYQRLRILSDRQLAARGLTREDVPQLVFDRHFR